MEPVPSGEGLAALSGKLHKVAVPSMGKEQDKGSLPCEKESHALLPGFPSSLALVDDISLPHLSLTE